MNEKDTLLERAEQKLADNASNVDQLRAELATMAEERDALTTELQTNMSETGRTTNEMAEVLGLRDSMAEEYAMYRNNSENTLCTLRENDRQKEAIIEQVMPIRRIVKKKVLRFRQCLYCNLISIEMYQFLHSSNIGKTKLHLFHTSQDETLLS